MLKAALAILLFVLGAGSGAAAREADRRVCVDAAEKPDVRHAACGRVLADPAAAADDRVAALYSRSGILFERRQYEAVIKDLDQILKLKPTYALALNRRGITQAELGRQDQAIEDFDLAIAADPAYPNPLNNRGNVHRNRGNLDRAMADYDAALKIEPNYLYPLRNRAYTYERMGYFAEAERAYRQVLDAPGRPDNGEDRRAKREAEADLKRLAAVMEARSRSEPQLPRRAALVIANSKYKGGTFDALKTPASDARAIADALKRLGFKDEDVVEKYDLDRRGLVTALRDFEGKARSADWAVVFFAGHGVRARSNLDYLIPVDARIESEKDLADEAVALERVVERIADARKLQLVVFDACRSNELTRRLYSAESVRRSATAQAPFEAPGLMLAFSARRGQSAFDGKSHSPFVEGLLANLEKPGADLEAIFAGTAEHVRKATRERQTPEIFGIGYGKGLVLKPGAVAAGK